MNIELTNRCNFKCDFCPSRYMTRPRKMMAYALARKIIAQIAESALDSSVTFHIMGEPLLHPKLGEIAKYARHKGLVTGLVTNGSLLYGKRLREICLNFDYVVVSFHSFSSRMFQGRHSAISYRVYVDRVQKAVKTFVRYGVNVMISYIEVDDAARYAPLMFVSSGFRKKIVAQWSNFFKKIDFNRAYKDPLFSDDVSFLTGNSGKVKAGSFVLREGYYRVHEYCFVIFRRLVSSWAFSFDGKRCMSDGGDKLCSSFWRTRGILADGRVVMCCGDYEGEFVLGDIRKERLEKIFNRKIGYIKKIMAMQVRGHSVLDMCRRCRGDYRPFADLR